ncbi:hypothetical protein BDZ91DRAFT_716756 [Kalaharituber pfeilii]|nr:hypothetical protein BDZ91DRAFT_716756 [Kalaharituber pfeilii]
MNVSERLESIPQVPPDIQTSTVTTLKVCRSGLRPLYTSREASYSQAASSHLKVSTPTVMPRETSYRSTFPTEAAPPVPETGPKVPIVPPRPLARRIQKTSTQDTSNLIAEMEDRESSHVLEPSSTEKVSKASQPATSRERTCASWSKNGFTGGARSASFSAIREAFNKGFHGKKL